MKSRWRPPLFILACWLVFSVEFLLFSSHTPNTKDAVDVLPRPPSHQGKITSNLSITPPPRILLDNTLETIEEDIAIQTDSGSDYLVSAILPVTLESLPLLKTRIATLLDRSLQLHEVLLLCIPELQPEVRDILFEALSEDDMDHHADASIFSWPPHLEEGAAVLYAAQHIEPPLDRILILDSDGLDGWDQETREMLAGRFATPLPVGPRGYDIHEDKSYCLTANATPNVAAFVVPPFSIAPLLVPPHDLPADSVFDIWPSLGNHIARARYEGVGGLIIDYDEFPSWCFDGDAERSSPVQASPPQPATGTGTGTFAIILPSLEDLFSFAVPVCRLWANGHNLAVLLTEEDSSIAPTVGNSVELMPNCVLKANVLLDLRLSDPLATPGSWVSSLPIAPAFVITVPNGDLFTTISMDVTIIQIPREDLPSCDWLTALPLDALRNWHRPQIEISIITNDRPESLSRLLSSLTSASFFGDKAHLRINVEQTADEETLRLADAYHWPHGAKFVHRRVVRGGLLPAVAESWYPSSNDSYGLMLEDDVELSPLFYAWAKMALLAHRYGRKEDMSSQLFGISLYQQKNLELRPEGRHPFNAQKLFSTASYPDPNTPYLSQIPCSWGAVYFPEHWREFHYYLSFRLSQTHPDLPIDRIVAPGLRSNKWTRSWKKYFIELVYLRGYVMLYPNFKDYLSLSTNHLEVGSHVREMSAKAYERKKRLYLLPLMGRTAAPLVELEETGSDGSGSRLALPSSTDLVDLPGGRMPAWDRLPVLDLLGMLATEDIIRARGAKRREELFDCEAVNVPFNVPALLCISDVEARVVMEEDW